jgi:mono/diheme cytochrome c family protein
LQWQLVFFRSGSRKNEIMQPTAEQLSNEDVRNLGAYFASQSPPKASEPDDNPELSKKAHRRPQDGAVRHATPTHLPERKALRALLTSGRNT